MNERPQITIRRGDRVRFRYDHDGTRVGRVLETTHCAAVVLWAPTLERLRAQEQLPPDSFKSAPDSIRDGTYSLRDLEHIR